MSAGATPYADGTKSPPPMDPDDARLVKADISAHRLRPRRWDLDIASIANRQHGLVTLRQLEDLGMNRRTAAARVRAGRLHRVHDGVFLVGYPRLSPAAAFLAAVLSCGREAVLSHDSAAALWGFREEEGPGVHVIGPNRRGRSPDGIVAHRNGWLPSLDRTIYQGIPCTTVARTLLDLAPVLPP
jgi:predicted transcriptional regulator of viral defense system